MIIYDANGVQLLDIEVDDTSVRYKVIKGDNSLTLKFSLAEHLEIPIGSWCEFKGEVYSLMAPSDISMHHRRNFEYNLVMYGDEAKAKKYMFINPVDGRLKFTLTAFPKEHLEMFVENMNNREPEGKKDWKIGECIDHERITLSYNMTFCHDALVQQANQLGVDYWFDGKTVNLGKLEVNKDNPISLSYGGDGQGLKSGIKRTNYSGALPIEILYVKGSEENIDFSKYGSNELHLPKNFQTIGYDGVHFSDEVGFDNNSARWYITDENGYSVRRSDKEHTTYAEDSLDCSEITPTKEEVVEQVAVVDAEAHFYDIYFSSAVDYKEYQIAGETAYVIFQTGELAGRQFDLATKEDGTIVCEKVGESSWRVELKPEEMDGIMMPDDSLGFAPSDGDKFKVFGIQLPDEYLCVNEDKSGVEWDMLRYAVKHLYANEVAQYTIAGELDEIFAKRNWSWLSEKIVLGGYVSFSDKSFQEEPILIRITGIKEYVNKPHSPQLELTNQAIGGTIVGTLDRIENQEVYNELLYRESIGFTKRRYRDAKETASLLQKALLSSFSKAVSPITINTMQAIVGDEALQFVFVKSKENPEVFTPVIEYGMLTKKVTSPGGWIQHMTLGIKGVSTTHAIEEYRFWKVDEFESQVTDLDKPYFLYVKANWNDEGAEFILTPDPIAMDAEEGVCYYFLTGILNTEIEGQRSFVSLYGFTEILPGQITTDVIRSADGQTYFDLVNGVISGYIKFKSTEGGEKSVEEQFSLVDKNVQNLQDQIDGVVENHFYEGEPTTTNYPASSWTTDVQKINHIGDTYTDIEEFVDSETTPNAGKSWRWCRCEDVASSVQLSGSRFPTDWYKLGTIDATKNYFGLEYYYNGTYQNTFEIEFDKDIQIVGGLSDPPVYVKIESTTGDVYVKDVYRYYNSNVLGLVFKGADYVEVTDKDGVTYKLHWHPIADTDAVKALLKVYELERKVDDAEYLKDTFKKGETSISGGVVMTEMVAVGEGGNQVEAFLNGSGKEDFIDNEHGKLILASGIPEDGENLKERAKEANTRLYEDGHFETIKGKIASYNIEDDIISATDEYGNKVILSLQGILLKLYSDTIRLINATSPSEDTPNMSVVRKNVLTNSSYYNESIASEITNNEDNYESDSKTYVALRVAARNEAIRATRGQFAGLRPRYRRITSSTELSKYDHTIECMRTDGGQINLTLPANPEVGQCYEIWKWGTCAISIRGNGKKIIRIGISELENQGVGVEWVGVIKLVYRGNETNVNNWLMTLHRTE